MTDDNLVKVGIAVGSFLLGAILSRFTMTKKERFDVNAKRQEQSNQLESEVASAYKNYIESLSKLDRKENITVDIFIKVESEGAAYFQALNSLANSMLSYNTEKESAKNSHVLKVKDGYERIIPAHYETLKSLARECDIPYKGEFMEVNYASMKKVICKFN
ncbi:hypothetical protein BH582_10905 [Vibrio sp. 10N.222.47.A9]|uniref:hypothetical protein n=1 Tax=Vibrio sp. 10N.222.47.A9 TaxID=1903178 RepID=UPI0009789829|nr:hypothetical protein [Vibrio sp. 10N.222.47.A9]OMO32251.1 hypothetical protein BH582_10905 [Vibrio sp. 10N.222.47.A9]